jgi:hypothetical protein
MDERERELLQLLEEPPEASEQAHSDNPVFVLADRYKALREARDGLKAQLAEANKALEEATHQLTDAMAEAECSSFTRGGRQFIMTTTTRWSAEAERKGELYDVLRANGYEHLFSVNPQTLGSFVKEQVAETADENGAIHVPGWLDGLVKSYDDIGVTMRKATKKSN